MEFNLFESRHNELTTLCVLWCYLGPSRPLPRLPFHTSYTMTTGSPCGSTTVPYTVRTPAPLLDPRTPTDSGSPVRTGRPTASVDPRGPFP